MPLNKTTGMVEKERRNNGLYGWMIDDGRRGENKRAVK